MDTDKDTNEDTTPGAVHVDSSSIKGQENDGSTTRRRALLFTGIMVILLAIIIGSVLGSVLGTTDASLNNNICEGAHPIMLGDDVTDVIEASLENGATVVPQAPSCGSATSPTGPGVWYTVTGNGGTITASTCNGTDFDSQVSVFTGGICGQLTCVDGNFTACGGSQSLVNFPSIQNQTYHVLVHGLDGASGNFTLVIANARLVMLFDLFVDYKVSMQALQDFSSPQYEALAWMANSDSTDLQRTMSDDELVERFVLVLLYFATGGANWLAQVRFLTPSLNTCSWNSILYGRIIGVGCNAEDGNKISRSIPTEIGLLSNLEVLSLPSNALTGTIPSELGQISNLNLHSNALNGTIPSELGQISNLQGLSLFANALTGTIPSELGQMPNLEYLDLHNNPLTGTIPSELGQLSTLGDLFLSFNNLTGTIPSELGQMSNLQDLWMRDNALTGTIPSELGLIANLQDLSLTSNALTGTIPTELGQIATLERLYLNDNAVTGTVPTELGHVRTYRATVGHVRYVDF
eukprot:scaffold44411_cov45-Attheya_sp.AAC.1